MTSPACAAPDRTPGEAARDVAAWAAVKAARHGATVPMALHDHALCRMLLPVALPRTIVVAQFGQSLDGRIATVTGASHYINGAGALDHLHRLRALVDAVVVGVGTVCDDDSRLTVRRVEGLAPARVVIDPAGRIPPCARALADDGARRIVIRAEGRPHCEISGVETVHLPLDDARIAPAAVVAALARRGLRRLLIEGGADTVSGFVAADAVDRLHVMVAPLLVGSGRAGLSLAPVERLDRALRPETSVHMLGSDVLFDCDLRAPAHPDAETNEGGRHEHGDSGRGRLHVDG